MSPLHCAALLVLAAFQAPGPVPEDAVDEVLGNVRAQPLGPATVGDLALPEPFLRRYADRILRGAYEDQFRVVIDDSALPPAREPTSLKSTSTAANATAAIGTAATEPAKSAADAPSSSTATLRLVIGGVCGLALIVWLVRRRRTA